MNGIVLFDGECNVCDKSVQFIIKYDKNAYFKFASLQSEIGRQYLTQYRIPSNLDSLILIDGDQWYQKSSAALHICRHLDGMWKLSYVLILIPRLFRDFFYNLIAKNRYHWFGKKEECLLPTSDIRKRFL